MNHYQSCILIVILYFISTLLHAEDIIIINNHISTEPDPLDSSTHHCLQHHNQENDADALPLGTYHSNHHGDTQTIISTGQKKPYFMDHECDPISIQPYIFPNIRPGRSH